MIWHSALRSRDFGNCVWKLCVTVRKALTCASGKACPSRGSQLRIVLKRKGSLFFRMPGDVAAVCYLFAAVCLLFV